MIFQNKSNVNLLSQKYISDKYSNKIGGEIKNEGTNQLKFVKIIASFYDKRYSKIIDS